MEASNGAFGACKRGEICVQTMGVKEEIDEVDLVALLSGSGALL